MTSFPEDPRREEAQSMPIADIVARLDLSNLQRSSHEMIGPCPRCGGRDRFGINLRKGSWLCRKCDGKGGGVDLVMFVLGLTFPQALDWLCGPRSEISAEERARRAKLAEDNRRRQEAIAEGKRREAIARARAIWRECQPAEGTAARDYLARRGFPETRLAEIPATIRYHPSLAYMHTVDGELQQVHRGPAMVACIQAPDRSITGVHRTWIDLTQAKGKALIRHPVTREALPSKKVWGHKKGCAIRFTPTTPVMVMGEGIETTLAAMVAAAIPGAAYWAGIDLGNMAGRRETGKGLKFAGRPDLDDGEAFVPPPGVERLVYIMDGDSDPRDTRSKLEAGLRRAMVLRPRLVGQIVHAGTGRDLNDVLLGGENG